MKQRFTWRVRDCSNLGILLTEHMKEKGGSAHAAPASLNQTPDALGNEILKKKKSTFSSSAAFRSSSHISGFAQRLKVSHGGKFNSVFISPSQAFRFMVINGVNRGSEGQQVGAG